ncbi:protein Jumonji [Chrysoperla carnea]|uniref:protein Jumonji n=1 Tax=Chrysoperla carnea TaxID=189513 RepID=UPI001D0859F4|nr:protein Jumonji [Chrysoperla carnea]
MPISKSESRRKRRSGNNSIDSLSDSPKRTKVHAQRKFAQGAALIPPVITQFKEIEKEKPKPSDAVPTELLPSKRPNTEDFLTFLCFRGTAILPPSLDFFNSITSHTETTENDVKTETEKGSELTATAVSPNQPADRPFVAFGVRKRADPFIQTRMDHKRRHALTVQALRRKYQNQRMAKMRAIAISKINDDGGTFMRTRSSGKAVGKSTKKNDKRKLSVKTKSKVPIVTSLPKTPKRSVVVKRNMRLRSGGKIIQPKVLSPKKKIIVKPQPLPIKKTDTSSEFSSDDNQPLVKTVVKPTKSIKSVKKLSKIVTKKIPVLPVKSKNTKKVILQSNSQTGRFTRSNKSTPKISQRPTRKTKEAAALYMEMLGRKLSVLENEADDETLSIDSFPELPNVKRAVQRENEIKAQNKGASKIVTRNSIDNNSLKSKTEMKNEKEKPILRLRRNKKTLVAKKSTNLKQIQIARPKRLQKKELNVKSGESTRNLPERPRRLVVMKNNSKKMQKTPMRLRRQEVVKTELKKKNIALKKLQEKKKKIQAKKAVTPLKSDSEDSDVPILAILEVKANSAVKKDDDKESVKSKEKSIEIEEALKSNKKLLEEPLKSKKIQLEETISSKKILLEEPLKPKKIQLEEPLNSKKIQLEEPLKSKKILLEEPLKSKKIQLEDPLKSKKIQLGEPLKLKKIQLEEPLKSKKIQLAEPSAKVDEDVKNDNFSDSDEEPLASKIKNDTSECNSKIKSITERLSIDEKLKAKSESGSLKEDQSERRSNTSLKEDKKDRKSNASLKEDQLAIIKEDQLASLKEDRRSNSSLKEENICKKDNTDERKIKDLKNTKKKEFDESSNFNLLPSCSTTRSTTLDNGSDFLCKDIGRRFGKGKVNMSNEQIEKWLNDADEELKKESIKKSSSTETIFKFDDKPDFNESEIKTESIVNLSDDNKTVTPEKRPIFQQRRPIINKMKERKEKTPSATAFSPDNESSVYAFEAESEMPINTPFRRHYRRPSSTTSKSEDEAAKITSEDESKKLTSTKFRIPTVFRHDDVKNSSNNQQLSLTLGADDSSNQCASIAVQVDLTGNLNENLGISSECPTTPDMGDESDGHLFYIPLQTGKQSSTDQQVIQGVAVKLGTTGPNGPNQRVIMQAKLVTKPTNPNQATVFANKSLLPQQNRASSMYPPVGTVQPFRSKPSEAVKPMMKTEVRSTSDHSLSSDDIKIDRFKTIPTSPSASSSSSAHVIKRSNKIRPRNLIESPSPAVVTTFPSQLSPAQIVEAPTFHPTEKEFQDPLEYIDKIRPMAESFGLCRIVPPQGFKPECKVSDDMRFTAYNQYVHKMLYRWGPNFRELTAIKKYLATQNITLNQAPWIGGMEVDLPRLYQTVQSLGGLKEVIEKKKWPRVAESMRIPKSAQDRVTKLDDIYCKYLLPYDTLSTTERQKLLNEVDAAWEKQQKKANNEQLQTKENDTDLSSEGDSVDDAEDAECIVRGRSMALSAFYRIARNTMAMWFKTNEPTVAEVEHEFWKHVNMRTNHLCVHSGSIDSGGYGYGFVCSKSSPFARHPWNLKVLTNNTGSILRSMGPIMGVTVPTLHVGMVFSACCWYRDPHGLPWIEYLHTGASKVWYGIPGSLNTVFRQTVNKLIPNVCRKTPVWLPSDTAMIPPSLLVSNNVSLCRTVQEPGQYIVIFPNAFTSSLCTGYTVSESVFFAQTSWLENSESIFSELKESCEPSMFSLERLLLSMAVDTRCTVDILKRILSGVQNIRDKESVGRDKLRQLGVTIHERLPQSQKKKKKADTDGEYLCEVCKSNLYVSLVTEIQDDEVFCLQHAAEYITSNKIATSECKLMYTYTEEELCEIVDRVINAIDTKPQKKQRSTI